VQFLGYPKEQATPETEGNYGGELTLLDGEVKIAFILAVHSSAIAPLQGQGDAFSDLQMAGGPAGFLITIRNGPTIYHTGDTDLFSDMALISHFHRVDLMLACIGDHFTMGPDRAAEAVSLVQPAVVVPMHFGTIPALTGTPEAFAEALARRGLGSRLKVLRIHESLEF
jgi:L-ascorbate metabolism protein UlaG (beta-lactamase superfamily)